jgi:hypothetical protein
MVYVSFKSAAQAEASGVKYVDGIVSSSGVVFVKKSKPPYKVVGYGQGYTFNPKNVTFAPNIKEYVADIHGSHEYTVHAVSPEIAKRIVRDYLRPGVRFTLYQRKTTFRRV